MGRFLLGVLFAFGLWWGYDRFYGSGAEAAEQAPTFRGPAGSGGEVSGGENAPGGAVPDDHGDDTAAPGGFDALLVARGDERDRLAAALVRAVRSAPTPTAARVALGETNAFLHVTEGRQLADEVVAGLESLPAQDAVVETTRLLEAGMNGPIGAADREVREAFDRLAARHAALVRRTILDPADTRSARRYEVQKGEVLVNIARHLSRTTGVKLEAGTLQLVNRIKDPRGLREGQVLKVPIEPIRTVIHKRSFLVAVYVGDVVVRTYWCAHGKDGHETPETTFVVANKIENPDWHFEGRVIPFGDAENGLGTRFVSFEHPTYTGFGIHGTNAPDSICTKASLGCVRLTQADIEDYFLFVPRGTEVEIRA